MVNDTTTLNGALTELGETIADNLTSMGVTASANDGLTTLANKVLQISGSGGSGSGQEIVSFDNITTEFNYTRKRERDGFSVTIPSGVTTLGISCFNGCTGLTNVTISSSVTTLESYCFRNCSGLTSVTIPSSVTSLGAYCFSGCTNLVDYQLYWETPPVTWSSSLMPNNTDTYFTIPNGTTANYTAKKFPSDKLIERSA